MPQNGSNAVAVQPKVDATAKQSVEVKDDSYLFVQLTQASYDSIKEVVDRATDRGLESSFDHWLNDAIKAGTQARLRTWNDRDVVTLFKQASQGNDKAKQKLAKLLHLSNASQ
jgi:hypothetical protein